MAGTPKSISMVKQILHLHGLGYGIKTISRELGVSKNTVKRYLRQAESKGLAPEAVSTHSNESLEHIVLEDNMQGRDKSDPIATTFPRYQQQVGGNRFHPTLPLVQIQGDPSRGLPVLPVLPPLPKIPGGQVGRDALRARGRGQDVR